jgi:regulator of cell morphogenesis and NO signaling
MAAFSTDATVRDIVNQDFRAAALFESRGIDFCCGGGKTLAEACAAAGADSATVLRELATLGEAEPAAAPRFTSWDLDFLTDYIESNHHAYVRGAIETILAHTRKVAEKHGPNHPEVVEIARLFEGVAQELTHHMMKEEHILFPFIRDLAAQARAGRPAPPSPFGTVRNPIHMMEMEHESAGTAMRRIRELSGQFMPPSDACATFQVTYRELQEFERDLHQHIHLENNILHPRAVALESGETRLPCQ